MIIYVYMCMYIFLTTVQGANGGFVEFFIDTLALILEEHRLSYSAAKLSSRS